jgi:hypothetical protein
MNWQEIVTYIVIAGAVIYVLIQLYGSFFSKKAQTDGCCSCNGQCGVSNKSKAYKI